ncbi:TetR/AcrR family transcriptional regulator [Pseudoduganella sp. UC29_106]|uniref:TetR/AcrR family transcriptional regulator n=1 Tax=Pseudoduganella sp. UC29_106 TaxID=3374553 RepID=UPI00375711DA
MARPREFDRAEALNKAMAVFWLKGYAGTSTADLLEAMQIGRQSMYDTFGDKHALYLEALRQYNESSVGELLRSLQAGTALEGLANMLFTFAARPEKDNAKGCMGVNAVCEFGLGDPDVNALRDASSKMLNKAVEQVLRDAVAAGEMRADANIAEAVAFIASTLSGMKVSAKAGARPATLLAIANLAISALKS